MMETGPKPEQKSERVGKYEQARNETMARVNNLLQKVMSGGMHVALAIESGETRGFVPISRAREIARQYQAELAEPSELTIKVCDAMERVGISDDYLKRVLEVKQDADGWTEDITDEQLELLLGFYNKVEEVFEDLLAQGVDEETIKK